MSITGSAPGTERQHRRSDSAASDIDYTIHGNEAQYVEIELDPGESAIADAGTLVHMDAAVTPDTIFGDGSSAGSSLLSKVASAGRRLVSGKSLYLTLFTHQGLGKARIAFAPPGYGAIVPFHLSSFGSALLVQHDAFLCAASGVSVSLHYQRRMAAGPFGRDGFRLHRLEGEGWVFIHAGGCLLERGLEEGDELCVEPGCIAVMSPTVDVDLVRSGAVRSALQGGENVFLATLRGPGRVWLQTHPLSRLAGRAAPDAEG